MAKKIRSDGWTIAQIFDVYGAIKRALIRRGKFPEHAQDNNGEKSAPEPKPDVGGRESSKKPKEISKKPAKPSDIKLKDFTRDSDEILYSADSVFPFQLVPDTITIDRQKVTIAQRTFIRIAKILSVNVNDMLNVEADIGPFFGTVKLTSRFFANKPQKITWLARKDAIQIQRILQGYIIAHQKEIDSSKIPRDELVKLLERLGQGASD